MQASRVAALTVLALLFGLLLLVACGGDSSDDLCAVPTSVTEIRTEEGFTTYEVQPGGYEIAVPSKWDFEMVGLE